MYSADYIIDADLQTLRLCVPHLITQPELNNLVWDSHLSGSHAELLCFRDGICYSTRNFYIYIHGVSEKTVQNYFCQNFVKFSSILIVFGR